MERYATKIWMQHSASDLYIPGGEKLFLWDNQNQEDTILEVIKPFASNYLAHYILIACPQIQVMPVKWHKFQGVWLFIFSYTTTA